MGKIQRSSELECLECYDKLIDCRDYIFCRYGELRYVGRKKDYETPDWCPKKKIAIFETVENKGQNADATPVQ